MEDAAGHGETLLHPAREGADEVVAPVCQIDTHQELVDAGLRICQTIDSSIEAEVLLRREIVIEKGAMRKVTDLTPHVCARLRGIKARDADCALGEPGQRGQDPQQRGLARTIGTRKDHELTIPHVQVDARQRGTRAEGLA